MCSTYYCSTATCFRPAFTPQRCSKSYQIWQVGQNWKNKIFWNVEKIGNIKFNSGYFHFVRKRHGIAIHMTMQAGHQGLYQDHWVFLSHTPLLRRPGWGAWCGWGVNFMRSEHCRELQLQLKAYLRGFITMRAPAPMSVINRLSPFYFTFCIYVNTYLYLVEYTYCIIT